MAKAPVSQQSAGVRGVYTLRLSIGTASIPVTPSAFNRIEMVASLGDLLPTLNISYNDELGALTHILPGDSQLNYIRLGIAPENYMEMVFEVFTKNPTTGTAQSSQATWEVDCMLKVPKMFSPTVQRTFGTKTVKQVIELLATEMGCKPDVSEDLDYVIPNLLQPSWPNSTFLQYLKKYVRGKSIHSAYVCMVVPGPTQPILTFRAMTEFLVKLPVKNFAYNDAPVGDHAAASNLVVVDNTNLIRQFGTAGFRHQYFDFFTGQYVQEVQTIDNVPIVCLSDYYAINKSDPRDAYREITGIGRKNEFTDFSGMGRSMYYKRLNNLVQIWIDADGDMSLWPGNIVKLMFQQGVESGNMFSFQYGGYWMISRVVHHWSEVYRTRLLLARPGVDTDKSTTYTKPKLVYMQGRKNL